MKEVKMGLIKWIVDATGCCKMVTWEDNVGILSVRESYKWSGLVVRSYKGKKYFSVPREGLKLCGIDDIGVVEDIPEEPETDVKFNKRGEESCRGMQSQ